VKHVEENIAAASIELPQKLYDELSAVGHTPKSLRG
jgi:aryl-alcohol dehydrogenase-like predicted oxidoreductase